MADKLTRYLIAGARLTGCSVSRRDRSGGRSVWGPGGQDIFYLFGLDAMSDHQRLEPWQPDRESSVSRQYYIETGFYLPVGPAQRAALGVVESAGEGGNT